MNNLNTNPTQKTLGRNSIEQLPHDASVRQLLNPITQYLKTDGATELCINSPGKVFVEIGAQFQEFDAPELTMSHLQSLVGAVAHYVKQGVREEKPILSATLPDGERIQIIIPPAIAPGTICICIRVPSKEVFSMDEYKENGYFDRAIWAKPKDYLSKMDSLKYADKTLIQLLEKNDIYNFLMKAVSLKKTIAVVGDTGSGKTTFMKTLCQLINTTHRLVTIEDVRELLLEKHNNKVHLLYSKGGQSLAKVTPADLIAACMRLKPDRVLLAELRGSEAFDFLRLLTTGHAGSITSFHAESCALATERYVLMCKEHEQAAAYEAEELKRLVALTVDIVIHVTADIVEDENGQPIKKDRYITEISYDPLEKLRQRFGERTL